MPKSKGDFVDFNAVKKSVSIVQVLEHYQLTSKLRRNGDSFSGPCPIHNGDNATHFRASISKNCWNCFGKCKRGGNILDFVSLKENVSVREAALLIQKWFGVESPKPSSDGAAPSPAPKPKPQPQRKAEGESDGKTANSPLTFSLQHLDATHPYLAERRLTEETIATFGLGFCKKGLLEGRIAIPIHNATGELVAYAGRWPGESSEETPKYKLPVGFKRSIELFNLHRAFQQPAKDPLVLVKGFFDCLSLWQNGAKRTIALMDNRLSPGQEELIRKHTHPHSRVIVLIGESQINPEGRQQIVQRLAPLLFVKLLVIEAPDRQPDSLATDELQHIIGGSL